MFAEHMAALSNAGYQTLTVGQLIARRGAGVEIPRTAVVLTFDDAFLDFHTDVLPVLARHRLAATLYAPTAYIGQTSRWLAREGEADRRVMPWSALLEAATAGVEVGSHSHTHPQLDLIPGSRLTEEIAGSRHRLEDHLQVRVDSFAYPFGYHNAAVRSAVVSAGYRSACAVRDLASWPKDDVLALSRWTVPHGLDARGLLDLLQVRTGTAAELRSDARAVVSRLLRRTRFKRRGLDGTPQAKGVQ